MAAKRQSTSKRPSVLGTDVVDRKPTARRLRSRDALVAAIARISREILTCETEEDLNGACLAVVEDVTQSKLGFIGEINRQTGRLDDIVISDPGWDACGMKSMSASGRRALPVGLAIHGVYGRVVLDGKGLFTNAPGSHPDSVGTPPGHPRLTAFLGMPLVHAGAILGMIGLGNRVGGYGPEQLKAVEALAPVIAQAILGKRTEMALRESEARFRTIFRDAPAGMLVLSPEGRFLQVNPALGRFLGYAEQELLEKNLRDVTHPDDWEETAEKIRSVGTLGIDASRFEMRYLHACGNVLWGDVSVSLFQDVAGSRRHLAQVLDITGRKQAEQALRVSEAQYRRLHESMRDAFVQVDMEGRIQEYNEAYQEMLGYDADELAAANYKDLTPRKWRAFQDEIIVKQVLVRGYSDIYEKEYQRKDGTLVPVELRTVLLRDEQGAACGMWAVLRDISDRKRAEENIQALTATLEERVSERTKAIRLLYDTALMVNQAQNAEQAIDACLQRVVMHNAWSFGHALMPAADRADELVPRHFHYPESSRRFQRFREVTRRMRLHRGEGLAGRVFASGKPEWITNIQQGLNEPRATLAVELGIGAAAAFPVLVGERVVAVLEFFADRAIRPDRRIADAIAGVGIQLGRVLERTEFELHLLSVAEEVQQGIAQDLHDDVGQELTGLGLKAETLAEMLAADKTSASRLATDIAAAVDRTRSKVRGLSRRLLPVELEEGLLAGVLRRLAAAATTGSHILCTFTCSQPDPVFDSRIAMHLYRIVQEAISNAVRHAGAKNIRITLERHMGETLLKIEDDGIGLSHEALQAQGLGLRTMRYRAGLLGGNLVVGAGPSGGTQVECRLPSPKTTLDT